MSSFDPNDLMDILNGTPNLTANALTDLSRGGTGDARRNMALQALAANAAQGQQIGAGMQQMGLAQMLMENVAKQKMELLLQQQELNLRLAQAEDAADDEALQLLDENERKQMDIARREQAAFATKAKSDEVLAREYANHLGNLQTQASGINQYAVAHANSLSSSIDGTLTQFLSDPNKGGFLQRTGLKTGAFAISRAGERIGEMFTGDRTADFDLELNLLGAPGILGQDPNNPKLGLVAAATRQRGFLDAMARSSSAGWVTDTMQNLSSEPYNIHAEKYASGLLADLVVDSLTAAGTNVSSSTARQAVEAVLNELSDVSRSTGATPADVSQRVMAKLKAAAPEIFGKNIGDGGVPQLVEAISNTLKAAGTKSGEFAGKLGTGVFDAEAVRNASLAYSLGRARNYAHALDAATSGKVLTSKNFSLALGTLQGAYDPKTNVLNLGAIPEMDKDVATLLALQGDLGGRLAGARTAERSFKEELAKLAQQRTESAAAGELAQRAAGIRGRRRARQSKMEILRERTEALRRGMPEPGKFGL